MISVTSAFDPVGFSNSGTFNNSGTLNLTTYSKDGGDFTNSGTINNAGGALSNGLTNTIND